MSTFHALFISLLCSFSLVLCQPSFSATLVHSFSRVNFTFRTPEETNSYFSSKAYEHSMPAGIKLNSKGDIFVSLPRWKSGVPATLAKVLPNGLLQPFPSWDMNAVGNATALQSVLGFEIAADDTMYVLDQGKTVGAPAIPGSIKVLILDAVTGAERQPPIIFTNDIMSLEDSFANDLVYDRNNNFLYIADSGIPANSSRPNRGGLVVVDLTKRAVRRVLDSHPSVLVDPSFWLNINGKKVFADSPMATGADGIALSCDTTTLYYTALSSQTLWSIQTADLRNFQLNETDLLKKVNKIGYKGFASDGLGFGADGYLYLTSLENSGILRSKTPFTVTQEFDTIVSNSETMQWPDTIGFDLSGNLFFVSNQIQNFIPGTIDFNNNNTNFRIWKVPVGSKSYVFGCSASPPPPTSAPSIESDELVITKVGLSLAIVGGFVGGIVVGAVVACIVRGQGTQVV